MGFAERRRFVWQLRSRALQLGERTLVMGVLNVTPDSFSDGGRFTHVDAAVKHGLQMLDEGADLLDIGGESTRPGGAGAVSNEEEQERVLPVLEGLLRIRPDAVISVDTYHAATARAAVLAGAEIVNDVSGLLWDEAMATTLAELGCGAVLMHTRGRPEEWASLPPLRRDEVVPLVMRDLKKVAATAEAAGVARERIVLDPGFGFGKRMEENDPLLAGFGELAALGYPLLAGASRKGFLARAVSARTGSTPPATERVHATNAAHVAAVLAGAHIVRVHDVRPAVEAVAVADAVLAALSA